MINILRIILSVLIITSALIPGVVSADKLNFEASVDRNIVSLGQSMQLSLIFEGSKSVPSLDLGNIAGLKSRYVGPSTRMSIVNGRMSSSVTHIYRLIPLKTGKFTVGPFTIDHENDTYVSNQLSIEVVDGNSGQARSPHQQQQQHQAALKDKLFLTMKAGKVKLYINEIIPLTIKLYVSGLSIQDIQYPKFSHEGFSVDAFGKPKQYQERQGGAVYDVIEFNTSLFSTRAGDLKLGPATLSANIVMQRQRSRSGFRDPFDGFFGRYEAEPIELNTDEVALTVLQLPNENRPKDFSGAVGNFNISVKVSPTVIKEGDPITMKSVVTGTGNFATVTGPTLKNTDNFKTYEPQANQVDGNKTFEQILIPTSPSVKEIPHVEFSYFDTASGKYIILTKGPFPITITTSDTKETLTILGAPQTVGKTLLKETFGRDIIYIKESPGSIKKIGDYLYSNPMFLLLQIIPVLVFAGVLTSKKRRDRLSTDIGYARRLKAPRKAGKGIKEAQDYLNKNMSLEFYDTVFRTLREYIGNRFHIAAGGITVEDVDQLLVSRNIEASIVEKTKNIIRECDMARYAPAELDSQKREVSLTDLKEVIDCLERNK